jgi:glycosyltransferase involved in cell wall biosynthesis
LFFLPKKIRESIAYSIALSLFKANYETVICSTPPAELAAIRNNLVWYCQSPNRLAFDSYNDKMVKEPLLRRAMYSITVPFFRMLDKFAVKRARKVFANSKNISARLEYYMDIDSEVLYQGVNTETFHSGEFKPLFLYPSRITRSKRFEMAIEAFAKLDRKLPFESRLAIVGFLDRSVPDDVKYFNEISALALKTGGVDIFLSAPDSELKDLYANCLCTVYTPKNEDFGLVPIEAAASGKACIGVNEGGLKETIIDGVTGYLVEDADELSGRMELILKTPGLAQSLGEHARAVCKDKFSWDRFFERFSKEVG